MPKIKEMSRKSRMKFMLGQSGKITESEKYFRFSFSPSFLALVSDYHWSNLSGGQMERKSGKYGVQRSSPCDTDWSRGWAENIPEHKQVKRTPWEQTPGLPHHTQHIT